MTFLRGMEAERAVGMKVDPTAKYYVFKDRTVQLSDGMEVLIHIGRPPHLKHEEYQVHARIHGKGRSSGDEFLIQYGDELYRAGLP